MRILFVFLALVCALASDAEITNQLNNWGAPALNPESRQAPLVRPIQNPVVQQSLQSPQEPEPYTPEVQERQETNPYKAPPTKVREVRDPQTVEPAEPEEAQPVEPEIDYTEGLLYQKRERAQQALELRKKLGIDGQPSIQTTPSYTSILGDCGKENVGDSVTDFCDVSTGDKKVVQECMEDEGWVEIFNDCRTGWVISFDLSMSRDPTPLILNHLKNTIASFDAFVLGPREISFVVKHSGHPKAPKEPAGRRLMGEDIKISGRFHLRVQITPEIGRGHDEVTEKESLMKLLKTIKAVVEDGTLAEFISGEMRCRVTIFPDSYKQVFTQPPVSTTTTQGPEYKTLDPNAQDVRNVETKVKLEETFADVDKCRPLLDTIQDANAKAFHGYKDAITVSPGPGCTTVRRRLKDSATFIVEFSFKSQDWSKGYKLARLDAKALMRDLQKALDDMKEKLTVEDITQPKIKVFPRQLAQGATTQEPSTTKGDTKDAGDKKGDTKDAGDKKDAKSNDNKETGDEISEFKAPRKSLLSQNYIFYPLMTFLLLAATIVTIQACNEKIDQGDTYQYIECDATETSYADMDIDNSVSWSEKIYTSFRSISPAIDGSFVSSGSRVTF